jgi:hypothetical protein
MKYKQTNSSEDSNATSNISYLLSGGVEKWFNDNITPTKMSKYFGPGDPIDIPSKGYTDPDWYFKCHDGSILGVGFRWGTPRLRGKGARKLSEPTVGGPSKDAAASFVAFIRSTVEGV